jgi:hypothetical protein
MASLRQQQIDEIINYDRAMNRSILDRSINQVTVFNDERAPPSNRDIKFEAVLGGLVDKLKASMAEALKAITSKQFPSVNAYNAAVLLATSSGERGHQNIAPANQSTIDKERQSQLQAVELEAKAKAQGEAAAVESSGSLPVASATAPTIQAQAAAKTPAPVAAAVAPPGGGGAAGKK